MIEDWIDKILDAFLNPQKRVFLGYLASALLIAMLAGVFSFWRTPAKGAISGLRRFLDPRIWFARSARTDYLIVLINQAVMMLIAPRLITNVALATLLFHALHDVFGGRPMVEAAGWLVIAGYTTFLFVLDDLSRYLVHRWMHASPMLWAFHKVHHTAEVLTPLTVYRTHPVEGVFFALRSAAVQGSAIAVFIFFLGSAVDLFTVLGASVFTFAFNALGSNLRHSHVHLRYGRLLERVLISPAQHQIHHSLDVRHHDRNFGAVLAVWDLLGRTLVLSERGETLRFGVEGVVGEKAHSLKSIYLTPFRECGAAVAHLLFAYGKRSEDMIKTLFTRRAGSGLRRTALQIGAAIAVAAGFAADARAERELDIYSHRQPFLIQPFVDAFTAETGVKVNIVYASKGLAQRLLIEGKRSPADLVLTVDIGRLAIYADKDLLKPVRSEVLDRNIPANLRDPGNRWFGLSTRARAIAVSRERVPEGSFARIEDLSDPKWAGRICSRPGSHVYNRALLASIIAADGAEAAEKWAEGLVANLARRPQGNDRAQVKAIYEGECDLAIINHYYFGKLATSDDPAQRDWAASVRLVFTNQDDRGNHINISGGGVAKYADNAEDAVRFLEFMTGDTAQQLFGQVNTEYPVNPTVAIPDELKAWGTFKADPLPIAAIAELAPAAQRIIDRVGW